MESQIKLLMNDDMNLLAHQESIRDRCFHPLNNFVEFKKEDIEQSIASRFERQAQAHSARLAVKSRNHQITYEKLNRLSNRIAHAILAQLGEKQEAIALLLEADAGIIASMLGVLKANKFFVPLDPLFPEDRIAFMLDDSQANLIITDDHHLDMANSLSQGEAVVMSLDDIDATLCSDNPKLNIHPNHYAYIVYTSGSTGQPKGILYDHQGVLVGIRNYTNAFHICSYDRLTLLHSPSFSSAMVDIFCALLNGASVFPWNIKRFGLGRLGAWLSEEQLTIFNWVPTPFRYFIESLPKEIQFPQLRLLVLASEPVYLRDVELYKQHFPQTCIFVNRLGTTETYNYRLYFADHTSKFKNKRIPAGYAVPDKQVMLLDDRGQTVEVNQVGEIAIKSQYLAVGYWRKPDLTRQVFLPDHDEAEMRIYRSGDLGILRPDGCLEYLGRKDFQVKIRGYRIEIAEIEAKLIDVETVKNAVIIAQDDELGEKHLIAYFVPTKRMEPAPNELRKALANKLPDYMIPARFVKLDSFPLTPTGKVDRKALHHLDVIQLETDEPLVAPRDEIEHQLSLMWERILNVKPVGIRSNFFELGGHSLSAMRLLVEVEQRFNQKLPQTTIFQFPTVEQLASVLRENIDVQETSTASVLAINPTGSKPPFFCMPGILGNVFTDLGGLSRHLGSEQPFYGLQDGLGLPSKKEALAKYFLDQMLDLQSQGPYLIGGVCSGALTAYELAQQLTTMGHHVALLALVEPAYPWAGGFRTWLDFLYNVYYRFTNRLDHHARNVSQLSVVEQRTYFHLKMKLISNMWSNRQYRPKTYSNPIHIISTKESFEKPLRNFQIDWRSLALKGIIYHRVSGTHNAITGDYDTKIDDALMQEVAKRLQSSIENALKL